MHDHDPEPTIDEIATEKDNWDDDYEFHGGTKKTEINPHDGHHEQNNNRHFPAQLTEGAEENWDDDFAADEDEVEGESAPIPPTTLYLAPTPITTPDSLIHPSRPQNHQPRDRDRTPRASEIRFRRSGSTILARHAQQQTPPTWSESSEDEPNFPPQETTPTTAVARTYASPVPAQPVPSPFVTAKQPTAFSLPTTTPSHSTAEPSSESEEAEDWDADLEREEGQRQRRALSSPGPHIRFPAASSSQVALPTPGSSGLLSRISDVFGGSPGGIRRRKSNSVSFVDVAYAVPRPRSRLSHQPTGSESSFTSRHSYAAPATATATPPLAKVVVKKTSLRFLGLVPRKRSNDNETTPTSKAVAKPKATPSPSPRSKGYGILGVGRPSGAGASVDSFGKENGKKKTALGRKLSLKHRRAASGAVVIEPEPAAVSSTPPLAAISPATSTPSLVLPTSSTPVPVMSTQTKSLGRSSALIGGGPSPTGSRRSSLPIGLKIPVRITQAQEGLKRDLGMVREFANVVEELQVLQTTYATLIDSVSDSVKISPDEAEADDRSHRYSRLSNFPLLPRRRSRSRSTTSTRPPIPAAVRQRRALEGIREQYRVVWECATLLVELGGSGANEEEDDKDNTKSRNGSDLSQRQLVLLREMMRSPSDGEPKQPAQAGVWKREAMGSRVTFASLEVSESGESGSEPDEKKGGRLRMSRIRAMLKGLRKKTIPLEEEYEHVVAPNLAQTSSLKATSPTRRPSLASIFRFGRAQSRSRSRSRSRSPSARRVTPAPATANRSTTSLLLPRGERAGSRTRLSFVEEGVAGDDELPSVAMTMTPENIRPLLESAREVRVRAGECLAVLTALAGEV
ncbi:hypothetical protein MIND_00912400 [Mycena indigotica]|uniref:Uncharacterized protein n=1 Tax=Mycena indigotica TaxID=2126181 RepID=A0A8H6W2C3_9AGAR|nr:uncharacterized protein MIND_00912400 [Mycena indigotica]KAF7296814.1 hypothetical protein MIND_00912400 [Mycena indigotica]